MKQQISDEQIQIIRNSLRPNQGLVSTVGDAVLAQIIDRMRAAEAERDAARLAHTLAYRDEEDRQLAEHLIIEELSEARERIAAAPKEVQR